MNVLILAMTHVMAFCLGAGLMFAITRREVSEVGGERDSDSDRVVSEVRSYPSLMAVAVLAAAIFLVTIGVQQLLYQRQQNDFNQGRRDFSICVARAWERQNEVLTTRSDATSALEAKRKARDDAVDNIIAVVAAFQADPPTATQADWARALAAWATAKAEYEAEQEKIKDTRSDNPYPELTC